MYVCMYVFLSDCPSVCLSVSVLDLTVLLSDCLCLTVPGSGRGNEVDDHEGGGMAGGGLGNSYIPHIHTSSDTHTHTYII